MSNLTEVERITLHRLESGDTIAYSQDGDNGWFRGGDRAFVGREVISLRNKGLIARRIAKYDETDNYRGMAEYDEITDAGRAALAKGAAMTSPDTSTNLRRALETIRDLPEAEVENGPEIADAALDAIDHLNGLATSPDTSAAEVVAWVEQKALDDMQHQGRSEITTLWDQGYVPEHTPLVLKSTLDTSRAETAAAKRERDKWRTAAMKAAGTTAGTRERIRALEAALAAANACVLTEIEGKSK